MIRLVHVKDAKKVDDERIGEHMPVGEGDAMLRPLFSRLKQDGYDGYLSLETHWRPTEQLEKDLVEIPVEEIRDVRVHMTLVGGEVLYILS